MFSITSNPLHQKLLLAVVTFGMFLDGFAGSIAAIILLQISESFGTAISATIFTIEAVGEGIVAFSYLGPAVFMEGYHPSMTAGLLLLVITLVVSASYRKKKIFRHQNWG